MSPGLRVEASHRRGAFGLDAGFTAPAGVTALFGRSGSGKTTLVNVIAGLVRPDRGRVEVDGVTLLDTASGLDVPRHRRRIGYVFQEARLFPHLSVRSNLLFGSWFAPREARGPGLAEVAALLGIDHLLRRRPAGLSGGERQRVAIGRALLAGPRLLLMDEPLASLDETRKAEILPYIERLRDEARIPIVYVSHAVAEVVRLADTVVLLEGGRVTAAGPAAEMLSRPDVPGLARAPDAGAFLDARVARHDEAYGLTALATRAGELQVPRIAAPVGCRLRLQVLARDVMLSLERPQGASALNIVAATVEAVSDGEEPGDPMALVQLDCAGAPLLARITRRSRETLGIRPGLPLHAVIKSVALDRPASSER